MINLASGGALDGGFDNWAVSTGSFDGQLSAMRPKKRCRVGPEKALSEKMWSSTCQREGYPIKASRCTDENPGNLYKISPTFVVSSRDGG